MKKDLLNKLSCINCKGNIFQIINNKSSGHEIVNGDVQCTNCRSVFTIEDGILQFDIVNKDLLREVSQWEIFAKSEGWSDSDELYLESLPSGGSNILMKKDTIGWLRHEYNFFNVLRCLKVENKATLDLGAGRCWSSKWLALAGADVVAFDAMAHPAIGLGAGKVFMKNHNIYFERVRGDFNKLPFTDESFDIVFVSGALHHSVAIDKAIREIARILKPNGVLAMANEASAGFYKYNEKCQTEGLMNGINEHAYRMTKFLSLFRLNHLKFENIIEHIAAYERHSPYYQGVFASFINRTSWGRLFYLILRGGTFNCILRKKKQKINFM